MYFKRLLIAAFSLFLLTNCNDDLPDLDDPEPSQANPYITHKINGVTQTFESDLNPYSWEYTADGSTETVNSVEYYRLNSGGGLVTGSGDMDGCYIYFNDYVDEYQNYLDDKDQALENICVPGSRTYSYNTSNPGVSIQLYSNSTIYRSNLGPQPGTSVFNVTESAPYTQTSNVMRSVKGTYSCRLFNENNTSEYIDVTDGSFYGFFSAD